MSKKRTSSARRSRLAIIASSAALLERNCRHFIQLAQSRSNAVLCLAPGFPIGIAASGPLEGASLANLPTDPRTPTRLGSSARIAAQAAIDDWRPDQVLVCGVDALVFSHVVTRKARLSNVSLLQYGVPVMPELHIVKRIAMRGDIRRIMKRALNIIVADASLKELLQKEGWQPPVKIDVHVVPGAGVDLQAIQIAPLPGIAEGFRVMAFAEPDDHGTAAIWQEIARHMAGRGHSVTIELVRPATTASLLIPDDTSQPEPATTQPGTAATTVTSTVATLDALPDIISRAHVCVALASAQTYSDSLMTALALGRPVVALDSPAHRRAVDERVNGILLKSAEPAEIIQGIETMLRRPDLFASMARASRAKAERMFDATTLSADVLDTLDMR